MSDNDVFWLPRMLVWIALAGSMLTGAAGLSAQAPLPDDREYVVVSPEGYLSVNGARQRYWAAIGKVYAAPELLDSDTPSMRAKKIADARRGTDVILDRLEFLGFNSVRLWDAFMPADDYTLGDGSQADSVDYFVARAKERGMRIWVAGMNRIGDATPDDVNITDDPATAAAWRDAIASAPGSKMRIQNHLARIWDPRLETLGIQRMSAVATHMNHHTGLRWCDDPVFAVWELSNEEWWISKMVRGRWQTLPPFFRNQLIEKWNGFLLNKYRTDDALRTAWASLLPGESLDRKSILFAPMAGETASLLSINDANAQARESLNAMKQTYTRADFSEQRGRDVLEFLVQLQTSHKLRERDAIKPLGKSTRLSPMIFDTGIGYEIQSQYLHQQADAVAHDAYINGLYRRRTPEEREAELAKAPTPLLRMRKELELDQMEPNAGPWVNWLAKPPLIAQGVPWLEHNRVEGKPFLCYETQIMNPAKYRADFPLRLLALASIQDWDWVCWHYFGDGSLSHAGTAERPFEKKLDVTTGGHPQGYHFTYDEVQSAMMRAAGHMFTQKLVPPAPNPTRFTFGRDALFDPASMDYAGSYGRLGLDMVYTVYQHGVRLKIDPTLEKSSVAGPVVSFDDRATHNPYTPNDAITFDWRKATLSIDTPAGVAFAGLLARHGERVEFTRGSGVTLSDVSLVNPTGSYDPVKDDERYIAFALHSLDGKRLADTKRASMSIVSTSYNTGFRVGTGPGDPNQGGSLPVLVTRVGATVRSDAINGMTYNLIDWNGKTIRSGKVTDSTLVIRSNEPIFVIELTRD